MKVMQINQQTNYKQNFGAVSKQVNGKLEDILKIEEILSTQILKKSDDVSSLVTLKGELGKDYTVVFTTGDDVAKEPPPCAGLNNKKFLDIPSDKPLHAKDILVMVAKQAEKIQGILFK